MLFYHNDCCHYVLIPVVFGLCNLYYICSFEKILLFFSKQNVQWICILKPSIANDCKIENYLVRFFRMFCFYLPEIMICSLSLEKIVVFWFQFHWSVFLRLYMVICQHWFRWWLGICLMPSHHLNQMLQNKLVRHYHITRGMCIKFTESISGINSGRLLLWKLLLVKGGLLMFYIIKMGVVMKAESDQKFYGCHNLNGSIFTWMFRE